MDLKGLVPPVQAAHYQMVLGDRQIEGQHLVVLQMEERWMKWKQARGHSQNCWMVDPTQGQPLPLHHAPAYATGRNEFRQKT